MPNNDQSNQNSLDLGNFTYEEIASKSIAELLGLELSDEKQQELEEKMITTVKNRAIAKIVDLLSDEDVTAWESLADDTAKEQFLASKNINSGKIVLEETLIYKIEMLTLGKTIQDKIAQNA